MKLTSKMLFSLGLMAAVLGLFTSACSKKAEDTSNGGIVISDTHYTSPSKSAVPSRYSNVSGVALVSITKELQEQLALLNEKTPLGSDRFFVLLNPKVPTEGILVRSPDSIDVTAEGFSNHKISVTGNVIAIDQPNSPLVNCFTDKYGFTLAGDAQGRAVYIDAERLDDPDAKDVKSTKAANGEAGEAPQTIELIGGEHPLTSSASPDAAESKQDPETPEAPAAPSAAEPDNGPALDEAAREAGQPADVPVSQKAHSLNVTPAAPQAPVTQQAVPQNAPQAPAQAAPAQSEPAHETAAAAEAPAEPAVPQDIAPTAQAISAPPVPQDIAPTSAPLE